VIYLLKNDSKKKKWKLCRGHIEKGLMVQRFKGTEEHLNRDEFWVMSYEFNLKHETWNLKQLSGYS